MVGIVLRKSNSHVSYHMMNKKVIFDMTCFDIVYSFVLSYLSSTSDHSSIKYILKTKSLKAHIRIIQLGIYQYVK